MRSIEARMSGTLYQLKITLSNSEPPIWRRFQVAGEVTLDELHDIIQIVMGWDNEHQYQFIINDNYYVDTDLVTSANRQDSSLVRLNDVIKRSKNLFMYEYDFGDGWEHEVYVEKIGPLPNTYQFPTCHEGAMACPPEDCGGIFGYYDLLAALKDPTAPEYQEAFETYGNLEPDSFDLKWVNRSLQELYTEAPEEQAATPEAVS